MSLQTQLRSEQRRPSQDLPNELGLPSLAGLIYLLGAPWGYEIFAGSWKSQVLTARHPGLWWFLSGMYFFGAFAFVVKAYFLAVKYYADYVTEGRTVFFVACDALLTSILMTSQTVAQVPTVRAALSGIGFKHLDWFLFGGAVLAFTHAMTLVVPATKVGGSGTATSKLDGG